MKSRCIYPQCCIILLFLLVFSNSNRVCAQIISTVAGTGISGFSGDGGAATTARMNSPYSVVLDAAGNQYIADIANNRIRKVDASGVISTYAGNGSAGFSGDGGPATAAQFDRISGLAVDGGGNLYVADAHNNRIRLINSSSGIINTFAGGTSAGFFGDGGPCSASLLDHPEDVCCDGAGNIYIADYANARVRMINTSGIINTIVGTGSGGSAGDGGPATAAQSVPYRLAVDPSGNLYICEFYDHKVRIVYPSGIINTFAGIGTSGFSGDGTAATMARISYPYGVAADAFGDIFICDEGNNRIRKVNAAGIISTHVGWGVAGYTGDGGAATNARIGLPRNVWSDRLGTIYFADYSMYVVRMVTDGNRAPILRGGTIHSFNICRSMTGLSLDANLAALDSDVSQAIVWSIITPCLHGSIAGLPYATTTTGTTVLPSGTSYTPTTGYTGRDSFTISVSDGRTADTIKILINVIAPLSPGVISGSSLICIGSSVMFTETVTGGIWLTSTGRTMVSAGLVTGLMVGTDTVKYRVTNICGPFYATFPVTVNVFPDAGYIEPIEGGICPGDSVSLIDTTLGGVWSTTNSSIATVRSTPGIGIVYGVNGGLDTVMYIATNACGADTATFQLYVNDIWDCMHLAVPKPESNLTEVKVLPNPNTGDFSIQYIGLSTMPVPFSVSNIVGNVVYKGSLNGHVPADVHVQLPAGIYIVALDTENGKITKRVVVRE